MIKTLTTDLRLTMYGKCLVDYKEHPDAPIFDPLTDIHTAGEIKEIFGQYANAKYWEGQHLYELADLPAKAGDWVIHKYVKYPIQVTEVKEIGGIDTYFFEGRDHRGHQETCMKVLTTTNYSLGLPRIDDEKLKEFINGSRAR